MIKSKREKIKIGVGFPEVIRLEHYGRLVADAFDNEFPYLVGTALTGKRFRDVDVRLILDDEAYEKMFGKPVRPPRKNAKWSAMCFAFSVLGREVTGLPIDFQIQQCTEANDKFGKNPRHVLGIFASATQWVEPSPTKAD